MPIQVRIVNVYNHHHFIEFKRLKISPFSKGLQQTFQLWLNGIFWLQKEEWTLLQHKVLFNLHPEVQKQRLQMQ